MTISLFFCVLLSPVHKINNVSFFYSFIDDCADLSGNPVVEEDRYRLYVIAVAPQLEVLDCKGAPLVTVLFCLCAVVLCACGFARVLSVSHCFVSPLVCACVCESDAAVAVSSLERDEARYVSLDRVLSPRPGKVISMSVCSV